MPSRSPHPRPPESHTPPTGETHLGSIHVLHLVRACNGLAPFERFMASYRRWPAGCAHRLVLLGKGFRDEVESAPYRALAGAEVDWLPLPDRGYDIGSYLRAARRLRTADTLLLLNSFSEILAGDWLAKLAHALARPSMGAVGATGSWASLHTLGLQRYAAEKPVLPWTRRLLQPLVRLRGRLRYPPFPNPHLRTNAVLIRRSDLLSVRVGPIVRKKGAYQFESGRRSLTRQLLARGLQVAVVGRDGRVFAPETWQRSGTLWQGEQENLLIADNQTRLYRKGSPALRAFLQRVAWCPEVAPFVPPFVDPRVAVAEPPTP